MYRAVIVASVMALAAPAAAQPLGTFRWQTQPYCNLITLSVAQAGGVYTLDGFDDQCGAGRRATVTGTAVPNPDGTIALGLNVVTAPDAAPVHIAVPLDMSTLQGAWRDSAAHGGSFVLAPNGGNGGSPRPTAGVGATAIDTAQVQRRVSGTCVAGQSMRSIGEDGSVTCVAGGTAGPTQVLPGLGLVGGGSSGSVTLGLRTDSTGAIDLSNESGVTVPTHGFFVSQDPGDPGIQFRWIAGLGALRAGSVTSTEWSDGNVGFASTAFGRAVIARGNSSFAAGFDAQALGAVSAALGFHVRSNGQAGIALGSWARAESGSFIFGDELGDLSFVSNPNQFNVRASGGTGFYSNRTLTAGVELAPGASAWSSVSDVNMKENFHELDGDDVLAKIAAMPVREWNYIAQNDTIRHVGPTAQDFQAAFGLGESALRISTVDADGIALRAIQALEARTRTDRQMLIQENTTLRRALEALQARLDGLEQRP
jgi:hypothetical protein